MSLAEIDPGRIGDVRVSESTIPSGAGKALRKEAEESTPGKSARRRPVLRNTKRGKNGRYAAGERRGQPARALLKATERARGTWDFRRVMAIVPLSRKGVLHCAMYKEALEQEVLRLYAGSNPGFYAWNVAQTAVRHEMRATMMAELLQAGSKKDEAGKELLSIAEKALLIKHLCNASDDRDRALERIGLERLSEMPDAIDPMDIAPLPPAELPADVLSPRERSPGEIIGEFEEGSSNDTGPDSDEAYPDRGPEGDGEAG